MNLPPGWAHARVGDIVELKYGKGLPAANRASGDVPVYGSNGVVGTHSDPLVANEGIVIGRKGSIGEVHRTSGPFWPIDTTYYVEATHGQPLAFWEHLFRSLGLAKLDRASAIPGINRDEVHALPIGLPPLAEQKRIVAKLEELTARSRRAKEALDAVPPLLDQLRQSILAAAFRGDLTADWRAKNPDVPRTVTMSSVREAHRSTRSRNRVRSAPSDWATLPRLPDRWTWERADEVVAPGTVVTYGIVQPGEHVASGVPYVRGQDIENGRVLIEQLLRTTPEIASKHERSVLACGDVLLCIIRHLKVAIVPPGLDGGNLTQGTVRLRPSSAIDGRFLAFYLSGPGAQAWMKARYFGLAMPRINVEDAREIPIPVPPLDEQLAIVRLLKSVSQQLENVGSSVALATSDNERLLSAVLSKAFRGELVPQNPDDEPALELLTRIRRTRDISSSGAAALRTGRRHAAAREARRYSAEPASPLPLLHRPPTQLPSAGSPTLHDAVFSALWPRGPLDKPTAIRHLADHLRDTGRLHFDHLHPDGPLYAQLLAAIESAVKAGHLDRPHRGHVRAIKPDPTTYTPSDWRHALLTSLGPEPTERDSAIRTAAAWAREHLGLAFTRLRSDGHIVQGVRNAITAAIRQREVLRHGATQISRAATAPTRHNTRA